MAPLVATSLTIYLLVLLLTEYYSLDILSTYYQVIFIIIGNIPMVMGDP